MPSSASSPSSAALLPDPPDCGLPSTFTQWRKAQPQAVAHLLESERKFSALNLSTGVGKSAIYMGWAHLSGLQRVAALTSTRGLSDQLLGDFPEIRDVRGGNNYWCDVLADRSKLGAAPRTGRPPSHLACDRGPCRGGEDCSLRRSGCRYYDAVRHAAAGRWPSTNYSYYLHQRNYADGLLGGVDGLVCDEAHQLDTEIANFLRTTIRLSDVRAFYPPAAWPVENATLPQWRAWADRHLGLLPEEVGYTGDTDNIRRLRNLRTAIGRVLDMPRDSVINTGMEDLDPWVTLEPLWPGHMATAVLFGDSDRVILSSATIRPKTMDLLGISKSDYDWHEAPSPFPARDRPVIWVRNSGRVDFKSRAWFGGWMRKIDAVLRANADRKGIIHSVSYARAREIAEHSKYRGRLMTHTSRTTRETIAAFKASPDPVVLVSPSVTTGYDFPGTECEFQIIPKVPFPVTYGDPVMQARCKADKQYRDYITMVSVVQAAGRGNRYKGDRCMTLILDDHWTWFRNKAQQHAPDSFWRAVDDTLRVPEPLEKL